MSEIKFRKIKNDTDFLWLEEFLAKDEWGSQYYGAICSFIFTDEDKEFLGYTVLVNAIDVIELLYNAKPHVFECLFKVYRFLRKTDTDTISERSKIIGFLALDMIERYYILSHNDDFQISNYRKEEY